MICAAYAYRLTSHNIVLVGSTPVQLVGREPHCFDNLKLQCAPILECFGEPRTQTWSAGFGTCPSVVAGGLGSHKALVKELDGESKAL
jgi:hypothetical protein